ncbi:protein unc-93 homolog A-like [Lingula anatina]|uniref:Protein unc-93 homolog A-like n=1 Tax=Lingula anatina TaxID=7574 RepID=A0A2R2MQQ5_LINAN|nr:protein unc-93 homolog A-like [Lingula anatina]|eukprot:XP_023932332.1 protein unc-93 homolog A-like [Lingula anatina]
MEVKHTGMDRENKSVTRSNDVYQEDDGESTPLLGKSDQRVQLSKWKPLSQLVVLAVVYMLGYSPLSTLLNLERILYPDIGIYALVCNFGGSICSLVTASVIAKHLGAKGSVLLGWVCQAVFIAAHFYMEPYVILPVAFLVGIGHAQAWITNAVFVTALGLQYSEITGRPQGEVMGMFQGIFFAIFQFNGIWGNLISALVLNSPADDTTGNGSTSHAQGGNLSALCGSNFCPWEDTSGTYITQPDQYVIYIILGCFLGLVGSAFVIALLFLKDVKSTTGDSLHSLGAFLVTVWRLIFKRKMGLILPAFMFVAIGQTMILTEFITAFVSCEIGIQYNGWTAMFYSGGLILGSTLTSRLVKHVGWVTLFVFAACCNAACLLSMLFYEPSGFDSLWFYFLIPFVSALGDAQWLATASAYVGHVFPDQKWPVFVTVRSFIYVTFSLVYAYSNFACMDTKVYVMLGVVGMALLLSIIFLGITKNWHKSQNTQKIKFVQMPFDLRLA